MKKIFSILGGYIGLALVICISVGFAHSVNVSLLPKAVFLYKLYTGLEYFFAVLPAMLFSGFFAAAAIQFGRKSEGSVTRFSPAMFRRYKTSMIIALICTAVLTFSEEFISVQIAHGKTVLENQPKLVTEYVSVSENYLLSNNANAARVYADEALKLDPTNEKARDIQNEADILIGQETAGQSKFIKEVDWQNVLFLTEDNDIDKNRLFSAYEYLIKARLSYDKQEWFNAHYFAQQGLAVASGKDSNIAELKDISSQAWNNLSNLHSMNKDDKQNVFEQKYMGYKALVEGDYLKAYYIFMNLQSQSLELSKDSDVLFYTEVAQKKVNERTFFIDETFELKGFESATDVYFVLNYGNSGRDLVYFRGVTSTKESGNLVQYLRGLKIISFDENDDWIYTLEVPYAKVLAVSVKDMNEMTKKSLGITNDINIIPYLMMKSVDRYESGKVRAPTYTFAKGHSIDEIKNTDFFMLPISFSDFQMIESAHVQPKTMEILSLSHMIGKAEDFGYSSVIFGQVLMNRILYPFFLLILFLVVASLAWNNRIGQATYFKASWIFVFPMCTLLSWIAYEVLEFIYHQINLVVMAMFEPLSMALLAAFILCIIGILSASIYFISRKASGEY